MDPTLVLTDEQKKTRFRKMIDKKGPNDTGPISPNSGTTASIGNSSRSILPTIPQEPKQPRIESSSSSSSQRTEFKQLHTKETRFGGQIRRSRTVDTVSPYVSSKDGMSRSRRFSGNKISTSRRTDNTSFEPIGK